MSTNKISAEQLKKSEEEREFWKNKSAAMEYKEMALARDPAFSEGEDAKRGKSGRPTALDRVREARVSGLEIREFEKGIGNGNNNASKATAVSPAELLREKSLIVRALAPNHSPEEIEQYLQKVSPYLDTIAMAGTDPMAQSLLFARLMGNGQQSNNVGLKDIVEVVAMVDRMKQQQVQPQTDVAGIANAMSNAMRTGAELAKGNGNTDPLSALNVVTPLLKEQTEIVRQSYEGQLALVREQLKNKDPEAELERIAKYRDMLAWGQQESEQIQLHRLHSQDAAAQRAYEIEKEKWSHELRGKEEDRKQKAQNSMISQVTTTLEKLVESPVIKELGKNVGGKIGMPSNPLAAAASQAAQNQLADPLSTPYSFTCNKCRRDFTFSAGQLTKISAAGGKWMCPGCSEVYHLRDDKDKKDPSPPGPSSSTF